MNRTILYFAGAGGLLLLAALALFGQGGASAPPAAPPTVAAARAGTAVFVAAANIEAGSVVTASQVLTATYPADLVPADAITQTVDYAGRTASVPIFGGQVLLRRQFTGNPAGAVSIPPGKLLVAFPATDMLNATGAIKPGDHVDLLVSVPISSATGLDGPALPGGLSLVASGQDASSGRTLTTQSTLQDIPVVAVGYPAAADLPVVGQVPGGVKVISCVVSHQQALVLKFVKDSGGTIDFAVRRPGDAAQVPTDPVTLNYLTNTFDFHGLTPVPAGTPGGKQGTASP